jgi:hypothetical protein
MHHRRITIEQGHHRDPVGHYLSVCTCGQQAGPFATTDEALAASHDDR